MMRLVLPIAMLLLVTRFFAACTESVGPGEYCQDGWFHNYSCADGYSCNDSAGWTCTKLQEPYPYYPSPSSSSSYTPAKPEAGTTRDDDDNAADAATEADAATD